MKTRLFRLFAVFFFAGLTLISCKKTDEPTPDNDVQSANDDVFAQQAVTQTFTSVNNYGINDEGIKSARPYYISVENVTVGQDWPKKMTINFDAILPVDAAIKNGRSGKIYAEFSGAWKKYPEVPAAGTNIKVTFDNYKVNNGIQLSGQIVVTYTGVNTYGGPSFNIKTTNVVFTFTDGKTMKWNTNRTIDWIAGYDVSELTETGNWAYLLSGTNTGTNIKGTNYTSTIKEPLKFTSCQSFPIVQGKLELTNEGSTIVKTINFGTGDCDSKVTVTINNITIDINLQH